jgi:hypothetical protein
MIRSRLTPRNAAAVACAIAVAGAGAAVASAATTGGTVPDPVAQLILLPRDQGAPPIAFEVEDYSFDIEQTLNIGSATSGAGAGKITFHPFSVSTRPGTQTVALYRAMGDGSVFPSAELMVPGPGGRMRLDAKFRLVIPITLHEHVGGGGGGGRHPAEDISFEYGGLEILGPPVAPTGG